MTDDRIAALAPAAHGHAGAERQRELLLAIYNRMAVQLMLQPLQRLRCLLGTRIGKQKQEFFASEAHHRIARAYGLADDLGQVHERSVADLVAVPVVDQLE